MQAETLIIYIFGTKFINKCLSYTNYLYTYNKLINLILLTVRILELTSTNNNWCGHYLFTIATNINIQGLFNDSTKDIVIRTTQIEILKILQDKFYHLWLVSPNESYQNLLKDLLNCLFLQNSTYVTLLMHRYNDLFREFFCTSDYLEKDINKIIGNRTRQQMLKSMIDEKLFGLGFTKKNFLFRLLDTKQFQILRKIISLSKSVLNTIDEDGNDLLLYVCLKVGGCRHRFIEFLIKSGSDTYRMNRFCQSFTDVIQLKHNRSLLIKLIEHEIINKDMYCVERNTT